MRMPGATAAAAAAVSRREAVRRCSSGLRVELTRSRHQQNRCWPLTGSSQRTRTLSRAAVTGATGAGVTVAAGAGAGAGATARGSDALAVAGTDGVRPFSGVGTVVRVRRSSAPPPRYRPSLYHPSASSPLNRQATPFSSHLRSFSSAVSQSPDLNHRSYSTPTSAAEMVATKLDGTAIAKAIRERLGAEIVEKQKLNPRYRPSLKIIQGMHPHAPCLLQAPDVLTM